MDALFQGYCGQS